MRTKPILFNTDMVEAILAGGKTVTRRIIKLKYDNTHIEWKNDKYGKRLIELQNDVEGETHGKNPDGTTWRRLLAYRELKAPYSKGDILYVRETWWMDKEGQYFYRADGIYPQIGGNVFLNVRWKPSIHMPKEAARIWLRVKDVSAEKIQDIDDVKAISEGMLNYDGWMTEGYKEAVYAAKMYGNKPPLGLTPKERFAHLWNKTVRRNEIARYGWEANPWVWVIEFERYESQIVKEDKADE